MANFGVDIVFGRIKIINVGTKKDLLMVTIINQIISRLRK